MTRRHETPQAPHTQLSTPARPRACAVTVDGLPCREPEESSWAGGCVHEHVDTDIPICASHRWYAEKLQLCLPCLDTDGHTCPVRLTLLRERTDSVSLELL